MSSPSRLLPLCVGLAAGAAGAWALRPATPASASTSAPSADLLNTRYSSPATSLVSPRLAGPEADAALDAYLALPPLAANASRAEISERSARLRALLTLLPTPSFDRLFAALSVRVGQAEAELRRLAFEVWTERNAPAAARWALAIVPGDAINAPARARYVTQSVRAWARLDFAAAYAWASALPDSELGRSVSADLLARLAATDPARALELARAGGEEFFTAAQKGIFNAWAEKNPAAAVQSLGAALLADNQTRWQVTEALGKWAVGDPSAAFAWLDTQSGLDPDTLRDTVWSLVGQVSRNEKTSNLRPFADALTARALNGQGQRQLSDLLRNWVARDGDAALAWLDSIPDAALRNDLLSQSVENSSSDQAEKYLPLALRLPPGPARDAALAKTLTGWAERDADAAFAWLSSHDDPALAAVAARVEGRLLGNLAATDPAAALARWQSLHADESRIAAAPGIANAWAGTDPAAATLWLTAQLPELPNLDQAGFAKLSPQAQSDFQQKFMAYQSHFETLQKIAAAWSQKDPVGMVAWTEALKSPMLKAAILSSLTNNSGGYDTDVPDRADRATRIATITDPALREQILGEHLETWLRYDIHAAREWIDSHDALSPEKAAELLTRAGVTTP